MKQDSTCDLAALGLDEAKEAELEEQADRLIVENSFATDREAPARCGATERHRDRRHRHSYHHTRWQILHSR